MNEMIDEAVIPYNFNWRAGIGKDASQQVNFNNKNDLYDGGIKLTRANEPIKYPYGQVDLTDQLLFQIDSETTDVLERHSGETLDTRLCMNIKNELKNVCSNIRSKYRYYLNEGFYNALYNACNNQYNNEFINLKEDMNAMTEFVQVNGKIYGNPLLIYGFFQ